MSTANSVVRVGLSILIIAGLVYGAMYVFTARGTEIASDLVSTADGPDRINNVTFFVSNATTAMPTQFHCYALPFQRSGASDILVTLGNGTSFSIPSEGPRPYVVERIIPVGGDMTATCTVTAGNTTLTAGPVRFHVRDVNATV